MAQYISVGVSTLHDERVVARGITRPADGLADADGTDAAAAGEEPTDARPVAVARGGNASRVVHGGGLPRCDC